MLESLHSDFDRLNEERPNSQTPAPQAPTTGLESSQGPISKSRNHCAEELVHLAGNPNPLDPVSRDKRLSLHGPFEGFRHGRVEISDEALDPLLEMVLGCEITAPEELSDKDREPDLDLVDPRRMFRREVESDAVAGITQERLARDH